MTHCIVKARGTEVGQPPGPLRAGGCGTLFEGSSNREPTEHALVVLHEPFLFANRMHSRLPWGTSRAASRLCRGSCAYSTLRFAVCTQLPFKHADERGLPLHLGHTCRRPRIHSAYRQAPICPELEFRLNRTSTKQKHRQERQASNAKTHLALFTGVESADEQACLIPHTLP